MPNIENISELSALDVQIIIVTGLVVFTVFNFGLTVFLALRLIRCECEKTELKIQSHNDASLACDRVFCASRATRKNEG